MRSISTPPRNGTTRPGRVTTMTCQLTATVECVADMMYQLTPMKFIPLPNSETNIAVKKYRNARCSHSSFQSTRCLSTVAIESASLLLLTRFPNHSSTCFYCTAGTFLSVGLGASEYHGDVRSLLGLHGLNV